MFVAIGEVETAKEILQDPETAMPAARSQLGSSTSVKVAP